MKTKKFLRVRSTDGKRFDIIFGTTEERQAWLAQHFADAIPLPQRARSLIPFALPHGGHFDIEPDLETVAFFNEAADRAELLCETPPLTVAPSATPGGKVTLEPLQSLHNVASPDLSNMDAWKRSGRRLWIDTDTDGALKLCELLIHEKLPFSVLEQSADMDYVRVEVPEEARARILNYQLHHGIRLRGL